MGLSEQSGMFYLGRRVQENGELIADAPVWYDGRDLTTHAVCVGMTGSGKTGLGIALIEEAALNGIPTLVIDPKGDMTNLMLTFPDLRPEDFRPWVDPDAARRRDLSLDQYAEQVAQSWRTGLAQWEIDGERIARLKRGARFVVYTPGSDAGRSVSIVQSLHAPALSWDSDAEILRETISSTASALLALVDVESDPVTGREHILLATIVERAWRAGEDIDLAQLIVQVQRPPFDSLGVLPLEVFYPERDRTSLMLALNGLLASPRFASWMQGDPLSVDALLRAEDGRPQVSIFSLAHLDDAERFFFVTLLLEQVRSWLRVQQGTPSLRALLYFDELYGFMPPHPANPPTKGLLLTLLKQARSQGIGLVLATQNPVDLDYKGLSNAGTWFVGKLQTANDRARVLEGLSGASLEAGVAVDGTALGDQIAGLGSRTFLMHNVHDAGPIRFKTRYVMSYLCGPLTRVQIRQLVKDQPPAPASSARESQPVASRPAQAVDEPAPSAAASVDDGLSVVPPMLASGINQYFMPVQVPLEWAIRKAETERREIVYQQKQLVYKPALYGRAQVRIDSAKYDVHDRLVISLAIAVPEDDPFLSWDAEPLVTGVEDVDSRPAQDAHFVPLSAALSDARRLKASQKSFQEHVYRHTSLNLTYHPLLKIASRPDESAGQFRQRCSLAISEKRDADLSKLEKRYQSKVDQLKARIRREERELKEDEADYEARKREELISAGESVFNLLTKRRQSRALSTASRRRRITQQAKADIRESVDVIKDLEDQIEDLLDELEAEQTEIQERWSDIADDFEDVQARPTKSNIFVEAWGVLWVPYWDISFEDRGGERHLSLAAFEAEGSAATSQ